MKPIEDHALAVMVAAFGHILQEIEYRRTNLMTNVEVQLGAVAPGHYDVSCLPPRLKSYAESMLIALGLFLKGAPPRESIAAIRAMFLGIYFTALQYESEALSKGGDTESA